MRSLRWTNADPGSHRPARSDPRHPRLPRSELPRTAPHASPFPRADRSRSRLRGALPRQRARCRGMLRSWRHHAVAAPPAMTFPARSGRTPAPPSRATPCLPRYLEGTHSSRQSPRGSLQILRYRTLGRPPYCTFRTPKRPGPPAVGAFRLRDANPRGDTPGPLCPWPLCCRSPGRSCIALRTRQNGCIWDALGLPQPLARFALRSQRAAPDSRRS